MGSFIGLHLYGQEMGMLGAFRFGEDNSNIKLGVVGSTTSSDVWILKIAVFGQSFKIQTSEVVSPRRQTVLLKFFPWYGFFFTPTSTTTDSVITNEIITYPLKASPKVSPEIGLICLCDHKGKKIKICIYIWDLAIRKSKKLLNSSWIIYIYMIYGFGYDHSLDYYKDLFIDFCADESDLFFSVKPE
ncbi:hypothetical protein H5410_025580 [Solanum commersonii]|uniref:Uncharacterized protein n=1 Tax=Solanum commersonii TaxID=4109 RepID=A0A9J5YWA3_SOLCO|nr:hypothetical protein H5410_025580 [Solanum commersonii]